MADRGELQTVSRFDNLGQAILALRLQRGWSQSELARRAGLTYAMVSTYERGAKAPTLSSLGKLLDALGAYPGELEEQLDRINDRVPPAGETASGGPDGLELSRFLGQSSLPPDVAPAFEDLLAGIQRLCRHLLRRMASVRQQPG